MEMSESTLTRSRLTLSAFSGLVALGLATTAQAGGGVTGYGHSGGAASMSAAGQITPDQLRAILKIAKPADLLFNGRPAFLSEPVTIAPSTGGPPLVGPGGRAAVPLNPGPVSAPSAIEGGATPDNYGYNPWGAGTLVGSVFQYSDKVVDTSAVLHEPYIHTGLWVYQKPNNTWWTCTASAIGQAIIVTAGHCVHNGNGSKAAGWIKQGYYVPAYTNGSFPYGYAYGYWWNTTDAWYNTGAIGGGYDVAVVTLNDRVGYPQPPGYYVGWNSPCYSGCLVNWELVQLGYPGNYNNGAYMQEGNHLDLVASGGDFYYGSGMRAGASGGPHIANHGYLADSAPDKGLWPYRNVVFAVTSWGYTDSKYKVGYASSLPGRNNSNNFPGMWNVVCGKARLLHGTATCNFL
jgi:V8-like Glu-specific endopeptidase